MPQHVDAPGVVLPASAAHAAPPGTPPQSAGGYESSLSPATIKINDGRFGDLLSRAKPRGIPYDPWA